MAKRFTDTDKWKDPWFYGLTPEIKTLWIYLCDDCDTAGVWKVNYPMASFLTGTTVTIDSLKTLGRRIVFVGEEKIWIPGFIPFQYGNLKGHNKAHRGIMKKIIESTSGVPLEGPSRDIIESFSTLLGESTEGQPTPQVKDKVKDKVKIVLGECEGIYAAYPRKQGKSAGLKKLQSEIKAGAKAEDVAKALTHFLANLRSNKTEKEFIPYFSTWMNEWRDWLDPDAGKAEGFAKSDAIDWSQYKHPEEAV